MLIYLDRKEREGQAQALKLIVLLQNEILLQAGVPLQLRTVLIGEFHSIPKKPCILPE